MKRHISLILLILFYSFQLTAQKQVFTHQDTLRGSITPERSWWDLTYYHLDITVDPSDSTINGTNTIYYRVLDNPALMQIDLQPPLVIKSVVQNGKQLAVTHDGNAHFIKFTDPQDKGSVKSVVITYGGRPHIAKRPPWDGGFTWKKDKNGLPYIATSCQGAGASLWWPCKDHMYDEPDSMLISVTVPASLTDVSNGRLRSISTDRKKKTKTYNWFVSNPINNYGVNVNIGDYVNFTEKYNGEKGVLDCSYWVLKENLVKAREHFKQVPLMLKAFEHWFGPYPFYEDSYKLVEVPYLGMEHQSSVTYGNGYKNGYMGYDLSGTGWGTKWDFIIVHESGHEWFGNSITYKDLADMWIHESFINYSESLFTEFYYGKAAGQEYVRGTRKNISNDIPIVGFYNVNNEGSGDMYYKGGNMLNTLRQVINDDDKWLNILRGINKDFYHQVVEGKQIENYISSKTGMELKPFFDQYLRDVRIPVFEYYVKDSVLNFRWNNCVSRFNMPLRISLNGTSKVIFPKARWDAIKIESREAVIEVDPNYYVAVMNMMGK